MSNRRIIKVFISQPMNGLSDDFIKSERERVINRVNNIFDMHPVEIIDSFIKDSPDNVGALWYLGESIKFMDKADVVYFVHGWEKARGCIIENSCAKAYNKIILLDDVDNAVIGEED